jgi:hypothetical protein
VYNTLNRQPVDRVPYSFDLTSRVARRLEKHYGVTEGDIMRFIGDDLLYVGSDAIPLAKGIDQYEDEFRVVWDMSDKSHDIGDWGSILRQPLTEPEWGTYRFPDGANPLRFKNFDVQAMKKQDRFVNMVLTGLFDICWHLRGFENFMMDMAAGEDFADLASPKELEATIKWLWISKIRRNL